MKSKKYYIEFVGQHTAGKTKTIHEIVDKVMLAPKVAIYPQKIKRSRLHFAMMLPLLMIQNLHHLCFVTYFLLRYAKWNWINYHASGRHLLKMVLLHPYYEKYDFDIWMKDDMLHLLPRLLFRDGIDVTTVLRDFFNHFSYRYDGVVYIDIPYEVMKERFATRFDTRPASRKANREPVYERSFEQTLLLRQILIEQKIVPVLTISGTADIHANAQQIVEFINKYVYGNS